MSLVVGAENYVEQKFSQKLDNMNVIIAAVQAR